MRKILTLLLIFAMAQPALAQEEDKDQPHGIQLRGLAFSLFEEIDNLELRTEKKTIGRLALSTGQLRNRSSVSARQFSFGVSKDDTFRSLGSVVLPETGEDFILVFTPIQNGYKAFVVRVDDPDFKGADTYLFNFSKYKIGIKLGDARQMVDPWKTARLRPAFSEGATYYQALFAYEKDGSYLPFNNTRWPVNSNTKALLFVFEDPSTGQLSYRSCTELAKR